MSNRLDLGESVTEGISEWQEWRRRLELADLAFKEVNAVREVGPARRSLPCECSPINRDPHPGGWCRYCGRVLKGKA